MKTCNNCGKEIVGKRSDAKFCSANCRKTAYRKRTGGFYQFNTTCIFCEVGVLYYPAGNKFLKCNNCGKKWMPVID